MMSDNGLQMVGIVKELCEMIDNLDFNQFCEFCEEKRIQWVFIIWFSCFVLEQMC